MNLRAPSVVVMWIVVLLMGCQHDTPREQAVTSLAYRGHEQDVDINCFIAAYPDAAGTRLDDCVLCHTEGEVPGRRGGVSRVNACDYCHYVQRAGEPWSLTLNAFGRAYSENGRDATALGRIEGFDSDGDGHLNLAEIQAGCFPGRAGSNPDQPAAPCVVLTLDDLRGLPNHRQFMLLNSHQQRCDSYVTYRGVRFSELLASLGVEVAGIDGITVFAPDGFAKTYTREQVTGEYPAAEFHPGLDDAVLGEGRGIVAYPDAPLPPGPAGGTAVRGPQYLLLAFERDSAPLEASTLDARELKIRGEGPYRSVRPQRIASRPDRGARYPLGDDYDYDDSLDHNAGDSVRGVTVIRIDPMPQEFEEFDAMNASWRFLERKKLVIYGHGIR